jgi:hypothetical protein
MLTTDINTIPFLVKLLFLFTKKLYALCMFSIIIFKYLDNLVFQRLQVLLFFNRPRTLSTIRGIGEIEQSDVSFPVSESVDFNANVVTWESQLMRLLWTTVSI